MSLHIFADTLAFGHPHQLRILGVVADCERRHPGAASPRGRDLVPSRVSPHTEGPSPSAPHGCQGRAARGQVWAKTPKFVDTGGFELLSVAIDRG